MLLEKIYQLLLIGLQGPTLLPFEERLLRRYSPGGVILFGRNIVSASQVAELCARVYDLCETTPVIAIDQEGGRVDRLRSILMVALSPEDFSLGTGLLLVRRFGEITAGMLRSLGINMNLAPVVDLEIPATDNALRGRLWGSDPEAVVERAGAFLEGMKSESIIGCLKHFPGLGRARVDSHFELPSVTVGLEELRRSDLAPFARLAATAPAVMLAHCRYSAIDGGRLPASLSPEAYRLLRDETGFAGVALTDDLEMGALSIFDSWEEKLAAAINAGADMLPICSNEMAIEKSFDILPRLRDRKVVSEVRLDEATARIELMKSTVLKRHLPVDNPDERLAILDERLRSLRREVVPGERKT